MKLIQNEMAAVGSEHPHNRKEAVEILVVVKNAKFKNNYIELVSLAQSSCFHHVGDRILDRNLSRSGEGERVTLVFFGEIDDQNVGSKPRKRYGHATV